ncbi:SRPBCC family protein [Pseudonocardia sp.]|uniref:SRPBCC family protein n=1 Tax=Pseudonocardia sp. TaxID=60912 RepID=UPI003D0C8BAE
MPVLTFTGATDAPVEEVWKLLFDPARYPQWWAGVETVRLDGPGSYTQWLCGRPGLPMPQQMSTDRTSGRVTISCQVNDVAFTWQLAERGAGTVIEVRVLLAEHEAHREPMLTEMITASLPALAALAESGAGA